MLRDQVNAAIQTLKNLGRPVEHWDDILVFLVTQKLDKASREALELKLGTSVTYPTYEEFNQFLNARISALETILPVTSKDRHAEANKVVKSNTLASHAATTVTFSCPAFTHLLYQCSTFSNQTPAQRVDLIRKTKRCLNCFSSKHTVKDCTNIRSCKHCHKKHHTMLHVDPITKTSNSEPDEIATTFNAESETEVATHCVAKAAAPRTTILLATARVRVLAPNGRIITARALLDQGSVATLITETLAQCLRLAKVKQQIRVTSIGEMNAAVRHSASIIITSTKGDGPAYSTSALILKSLTKYTPGRVSSTGQWTHLSDLTLADNEPMSHDAIDIIIGADLYGQLILEGVRKGSANEPVAQNTTLSWILSGPIGLTPSPSPLHSVHIHDGTVLDDLDLDIRRFWEIEEIPQKTHLNPDEIQCEEHFLSTHTRNSEGRYTVRLPFKNGPPIELGESRSGALANLYRLENRLVRQPVIETEYRDFLEEYLTLGHMEKVHDLPNVTEGSQNYYIPHHAVVVGHHEIVVRLRIYA